MPSAIGSDIRSPSNGHDGVEAGGGVEESGTAKATNRFERRAQMPINRSIVCFASFHNG